jgi:hypothetical protein
VPLAGERVWDWFWDLRASCPDGFGKAPVSYQEIDAWIRCTGLQPRRWEIRAIRVLDIAFHQYHHDKKSPGSKD